ncbi:lipocalin-like domain-containing protein [Pseudogulbenkiania subflava]|uniref:Lipocalin-like domain-containing protein n=1 Tax=Pseudogulbenkiania subflava DSM 22618 TaxID=1123014 RepID=A0A1Y6BVU8_9NEIS|nr:lipocalin-like domain-containing protein [Pseudogulbenkiania subflava]SMF22640.1 Lipocalin-like domain-containing protein [Pseudogulbenkiania subflava DSM 22618]
MYRFGMRLRAARALFLLGMALPGSTAIAQPALKDQLVGTWSYVSVDLIRPDGTRIPLFGPNPQGQANFDGNGRYILMTVRAGQAKFASSNRMEGTPEEDKAVVQGSIAHFGRYTVDEANRTITFHIETSTFPNWNGTEQKRPFTVTGDELTWRTLASTGDGIAEVVLKRAR